MSAELLLQHFDRISEAPDAIPRLRQFVLELAMRGKLVMQDSTEEPATELLKCIQAERKRRIKHGRMKKQKPLSSVQPDEVWFRVPATWQWVRLGAVAHVVMGQSPPGETYNTTGEGIPLINGPVEFTEGPFGKTVVNQYTTAPTNLCEADDLLLCVRGSTTGRTNIAAFHACIGRGVAAIQSLFDDAYLRLFVWRLRESIIAMGRGIAFPSVSRKQIEELAIPLPPLAEQHRIVAKVHELMALCDQLEAAKTEREQSRDRLVAASLHHLNPLSDAEETNTPEAFRDHAHFIFNHLPRLTTRLAHIKQLRQTILNLAVRGKLVPQDPNDEPAVELLKRIAVEKARLQREGLITVEKPPLTVLATELPFSIPSSWQWAQFIDYATDISTGPFGSILHQSDYVGGGVPLVNPSHMVNGRIVPEQNVAVSGETAKRLGAYRLHAGDIVMARRGEVGRAAVVSGKEDGWLCGTGSFFLRFADEVCREFLMVFLRCEFVRKYLAGEAVGITMVNLTRLWPFSAEPDSRKMAVR
jgi:type I restriction enzyme S subunit